MSPGLLDALPLPALLLDARLHMTATSAGFAELVGRPAAMLAGRALADFLVDHADDDDAPSGARDLAARLRALPAGRTAHLPLVLRDASHEARRVRVHLRRLDGTGALPDADFLVQVETQDDAPQAATVSQPLAWYRTLFLESVLPKLLLDERFQVVDANDVALELLRRPLADLLWRDPAEFVADDAARERLRREREAGETGPDAVQEARAYPLVLGDGMVAKFDAVLARDPADSGRALRQMTLAPHVGVDTSDYAVRWQERYLAAVRDEQRMLPMRSVGAALVVAGELTRMSASFAGFFDLATHERLPLERLVGRRTARAIEDAAGMLDEDAREPYRNLPVVEFVWSSTSGRPSSFVAMARPAGAPDTLLLTVVDTSGQDADIAQRLERLADSRDALLRQVHHQVGNNLAGLAELVRAEARWNPESQALLERVASRLLVAGHVEGLQPHDYAHTPQPIAELVRGIARSIGAHFGARVEVEGPAPDAPARWVVRSERLALALACNELVTNAIKHRTLTDAPVRIRLDVGDEVGITVRNPGRLSRREPGDEALREPPQGVRLMRRLLPERGARFDLSEEDGEVVGRILLSPPAIY